MTEIDEKCRRANATRRLDTEVAIDVGDNQNVFNRDDSNKLDIVRYEGRRCRRN